MPPHLLVDAGNAQFLFPDINKRQKKSLPSGKVKTVKLLTVIRTKANKSGRKRRPAGDRRDSPYMALLRNPFNLSAFGSKVSDPRSKFTDTYCIRSDMKITSPSGTTTAAYCFKPNPFLSFIDVQSWAQGVSTTSAAGWTPVPTNTSFFAASTPTALGNQLSDYRLVAHGLKIRLELPQQVATGRLVIARAPRAKSDPSFAILSANTCQFQYGYPTVVSTAPTILNSAFMLELPGAREFSLLDLIGCDIGVNNYPNSFEAFSFSPTVDIARLNGNTYYGQETVDDANFALFGNGLFDNKAGWDDIYLYFDGLPSSANPIANIEVVFHLEGSPTIASNSVITAVPSHPPTSGESFLGLDSIMKAVGYMPELIFDSAPRAYEQATGRSLARDAMGAAKMFSGGRRPRIGN